MFANEILVCFLFPIHAGVHRAYHLATTAIHIGASLGPPPCYLPARDNCPLQCYALLRDTCMCTPCVLTQEGLASCVILYTPLPRCRDTACQSFGLGGIALRWPSCRHSCWVQETAL